MGEYRVMTNYENAGIVFPAHKPFYFGDHLIVNLYDCDPYVVTSGPAITQYARECVRLLDMRPFGQPQVQHFGHESPVTSGYTLVQLIETSNITAHFSDAKLSAYIDIFSCKAYDRKLAREHASEFFGAKHCTYWEIVR